MRWVPVICDGRPPPLCMPKNWEKWGNITKISSYCNDALKKLMALRLKVIRFNAFTVRMVPKCVPARYMMRVVDLIFKAAHRSKEKQKTTVINLRASILFGIDYQKVMTYLLGA
jgi:hypothetical protein